MLIFKTLETWFTQNAVLGILILAAVGAGIYLVIAYKSKTPKWPFKK